MEKITKKMCAKASPRPRFILANNSKQPLQARNSFKNRYFEIGSSKSLKKVNFIFLSNPLSFNGQDFEKMKGPCTSDHSIFRLQNKVKNIPLLVMY